MSEKITYKDRKGNVYERVNCAGCHVCDLNGSGMNCVDAPCGPGKGWRLVNKKLPDVAETLRAAIETCQQVRDHDCDFALFPCPHWAAKTCPSRKHLAALGDENAWRAK